MTDFTPHEAPARSVQALPVQPPARLIGREVTLTRVYSQLRELKPVLLYGPPGIGKSALAATLASAYTEMEGGALYLTVHNDTVSELIARVGRAYRDEALTEAESPLSNALRAAERLAEDKPLLVLDGLLNPHAVTEFVTRCANAYPMLLVNESEIEGPWTTQRLGKLEPAAAVAMFKAQAGAQSDSADADIAALADTLGYTPFALSVAAGWARANKGAPAAFTALLPKSPSPDVPPSLLALTASFRSLGSGATNALQGLLLVMGATFTGSASAEMMGLVAGAPTEIITGALNQLVQRGLIERSTRYGQPYYRLHEITYTFLQTWLRGSKSLDPLQAKVREAVRVFTRRYADAARANPGDATAGDRLAAEMELILATAQWAAQGDDRDLVNQLAGALLSAGAFVSERGYTYDLQLLRRLSASSTTPFPAHAAVAEPARPVAPAPGPVSIMDTLAAAEAPLTIAPAAEEDEEEPDAPDLIPLQDDADDEVVPEDATPDDEADVIDDDADEDEPGEAEIESPLPFVDDAQADSETQQHRRAAGLARQAGDRRTQADELASLARTQEREGKDTEAIATASEALALYEELNDTPGMLSALEALARLTVRTENAQAAVLHASRGAALAREFGNAPARMALLAALGDARQLLGESEDALRAYSEALEIALGSADVLAAGQIQLKLGYAQLDAGDASSAMKTWDEALSQFRSQNRRDLEARALGGIGTANGELGRWTEAVGYFGSALHIAREVGDRAEEALQLSNLADAHVQANQLGQAVMRYRQALHLAYEADNDDAVISTVVDLGRLLVESPRHLPIAELLVNDALTRAPHDRDLRRLKERIEDEREALGESVAYKPVAGTARDYAANAYRME